MEADSKNAGYLQIGFTVLNLNILVNTIGCDYIGNNHHNGGYTIVMFKIFSNNNIKICV